MISPSFSKSKNVKVNSNGKCLVKISQFLIVKERVGTIAVPTLIGGKESTNG